MIGKLAGIPYCPAAALAAAAANAGTAEAAGSSCPAKSLVGTATIAAGTGPAPLHDHRQGLPLRPLPRGSSLPGSRHPRHGRAV